MSMPMPAWRTQYTFADALTWDEPDRIELIEGEAVMMSPPLREHQAISGALFAQLYHYLEGKQCQVYAAPFAVRLFEREGDRPEDVDTMVEPDITVVCDPSKLDKYGCKGAPDLIIEILSPSTRRHDRITKLDLYQRAGVREYWMVNPEDKTVLVLLLDGQGFLRIHEEYGQEDAAVVNVLEDCAIDLGNVFSRP